MIGGMHLFAFLLTFALLGIGLLVARLILPGKESEKTLVFYGRWFSAAMAVLASVSSVSVFYTETFEEALARYLVFMVAFPALAFPIGYFFGLIKLGAWRAGPRERAHSRPPSDLHAGNKTLISPIEGGDQAVEVGMSQISDIEEKAFAQAFDEVDSGNFRKGIWAKALVDCEGDASRAKLLYTKLRAAQLMKELQDNYGSHEPSSAAPRPSLDGGEALDRNLPYQLNRQNLEKAYAEVMKFRDFDSNRSLIEALGGSVEVFADDFFDVIFLEEKRHFSSSRQFFHFCETLVQKHAEEMLNGSR